MKTIVEVTEGRLRNNLRGRLRSRVSMTFGVCRRLVWTSKGESTEDYQPNEIENRVSKD